MCTFASKKANNNYSSALIIYYMAERNDIKIFVSSTVYDFETQLTDVFAMLDMEILSHHFSAV
jgi:hypothetical protein